MQFAVANLWMCFVSDVARYVLKGGVKFQLTVNVLKIVTSFQQKQHAVMRLIRQKDDSWERDLILQKLKRRLQLGSRTVSVHRGFLCVELFISFQVLTNVVPEQDTDN